MNTIDEVLGDDDFDENEKIEPENEINIKLRSLIEDSSNAIYHHHDIIKWHFTYWHGQYKAEDDVRKEFRNCIAKHW
ncbi:unnamed protein product [Linum trigynum]|uniref:Uncharacterized protein n=1 Tax=Linum trigynum TaxID=586398 RepID=A0AAV2DY45_9ROSI